jgi:hypothetical protein
MRVLNGAHGRYIINGLMIEAAMPTVVTINRPDVVSLIETAANRLTGGNKTEAVALAMRHLLDRHARVNSLFGAHLGSVRVRDDVDLTVPVLEDLADAESGVEIDR